jgi:hypothetical protein
VPAKVLARMVDCCQAERYKELTESLRQERLIKAVNAVQPAAKRASAKDFCDFEGTTTAPIRFAAIEWRSCEGLL